MSDATIFGNRATVVVGVDGTEGGRDAVAAAVSLAPEHKSLVLVNVRVGVPVALRGKGGASVLDPRDQSLDLLHAECGRLAPDARTESVSAANVGDGLAVIARRDGAQLIVVGGSRRSGLTRAIDGDDTFAVLRRAPCPVVVAPIGYADGPSRVERIGVAFDGSPESETALTQASQLSQAHGARLVVRAVLKVPAYGDENWASTILTMDRSLHDRVRGLVGDELQVEASVAFGPAKLDLAAFSDGVDLLICGTRHLGFVKRVAGRSVSGYLARHCTCPVMIVPTSGSVASIADDSRPVSAA